MLVCFSALIYKLETKPGGVPLTPFYNALYHRPDLKPITPITEQYFLWAADLQSFVYSFGDYFLIGITQPSRSQARLLCTEPRLANSNYLSPKTRLVASSSLTLYPGSPFAYRAELELSTGKELYDFNPN